MNKRNIVLTAFLLVFGIIYSGYAYAGSSTSGFDVSIDRLIVNGQVVSESKSNLINDANTFSLILEFTSVGTFNDGHVEAVLRGKQSSDVVSDATGTFDLKPSQSSTVLLALILTDGLKREDDFELTIKIIDVNGNSEQKTYGIKTKQIRARDKLDVSIDRAIVNNQVVADSRTNFIEKSNDFDVNVKFTALEDLTDAHVEAILRDLRSGNVVADASANFDLSQDSSSSSLLRLSLLDKLKQSNSFELTIKIIDAEGDSVQKIFGIRMKDTANGGKVTSGRALDVSINSVEIEDKAVAENENNFVEIGENNKKLDVDVRLTSLENVKNAHVDAVLAFENGDVVADATTTFDIAKGQNVIKKLELPLIGKFEQNNFKLKVRVADADGDSEEKLYGLKISQKKFPFVISSIALSPEENAEAGKNIVATLNFKNIGVMPLEGINARVSIPELGVSSTKFLEQIKDSSLPEVREDFVLKILDNVPTGTYTIRSEISSQFGGDSEVKELHVFILGKDEQIQQIVNEKLVINVPILRQDLANDGSESIYPITLTNQGPDANAYTLLLDGANWAEIRLAESNTFVLKPKESRTINVFVSSRGNAVGEQIFLIAIKNGDNVLKQIPLRGNVVAVKESLLESMKTAFEIMLKVTIVLGVVIALFFFVKDFVQGRSGEGISEEIPDEAEGEAYY